MSQIPTVRFASIFTSSALEPLLPALLQFKLGVYGFYLAIVTDNTLNSVRSAKRILL